MGYLFALSIVVSNIICIAGYLFSFAVIKAAVLMANLATVMVYLVTKRNPDYLRLLQSESRKAQYEKSRIRGLDVSMIMERLHEIMAGEKAFADEEINLNGLAQELGISPHQLSEILNEKAGKNFKTFVNEYRVNEAKTLLIEEPDRSVLSIGVAVGFNSNTTFCTVFSRMTGVSPRQFRKNNM
jgi:AraC-like DNA-binding protein